MTFARWWRDPETGALFVLTGDCNCAAPDNGVGIQHEPACGWEQYGEADTADPPGEPVTVSPWDYGGLLDLDALLRDR